MSVVPFSISIRSFLTLTAVLFTVTTVLLSAATPAQASDRFIILQSTTSTKNAGLYDHLLPIFKKASGIEVRVVAVGTGQALKNAANCDADLLLVHATEAEEAFIKEGHGTKRFDVMYNDFILVGPATDPADITGDTDVLIALQKIKNKRALFASRGDDSGTHKAEIKLWQQAGIDPTTDSGTWYRETGSGMGATLNVAVGMSAYALTDRATWLNFGNKRDFRIVVQGSPPLFNQYGLVNINPQKCKSVKTNLANTFSNWLLSSAGQQAIAEHEVSGQQLFFPNAKASN